MGTGAYWFSALTASLSPFLHHGQYRGPADEVLAAAVPSGGVPGGGGASPGGFSGGLADPATAIEGFNRWEFWFEWNKDILLRAREARRAQMPSVREDETVRVDPALARREIAPVLREACGSSDPHLVRTALLALGKTGGLEGVPLILEALRTGSPETRRIAAMSLGLCGERGALLHLVDLFGDRTAPADLRAAAALGMGLQGRRESSPILQNYLHKSLNAPNAGGDERDVLLGALAAVGMLQDTSFVPLLVGRHRDLLEEKRSRARIVLGSILTTLGRLRDSAALSTLLEALGEKDIELRRSAALALGDLGDPGAAAALASALAQDPDLQVRGFAAISLGRIGGETAIFALRSAYSAKGVSRTVRSYAALGLGLAGDRGSAGELRRALAMPGEENLRGAFAIALGFLGDSGSAETLFKIVENRGADPDLRGYAAIALGMIRPDGGLPRLLRAQREDRERIEDFRRGLLLGIGLFGESAGTSAVLGALVEERSDVARGAAACALNLIRDRAAVKPLAEFLIGPDVSGAPSDSGIFACAALGSLGDAHTYPLISEAFFNANYRIRVSLFEELAELL